MPKGFTESEKAKIVQDLLEQGGLLFETYGLKKTNVEDITRAVGISKGAFYLFFQSKEELYFAIIEQIESQIKQHLLDRINNSRGQDPSEVIKTVLELALQVRKQSPLVNTTNNEELLYLMRKIPEAQLQRHLQADDAFASELIAALEDAGIAIKVESQLFSGLLRSLFFISVHEHDFGADTYRRTEAVLTELIGNYLVTGSSQSK